MAFALILFIFLSCLNFFNCLNEVNLKVIWFSCADISSTGHLTQMKAAIASALTHQSQNLYPVMLIQSYPIPKWLVDFNNTNLGLVLSHNLSFADLQKGTKVANHPAFLRLDIPNVIESVRNRLEQRDIHHISYEYALYTDTDVLFTEFFNIKELGRPSTLLIGPQSVKGSKTNSGVLFFNIAAMKRHFKKLINFAVSKKWVFTSYDQGLLLQYFANTKKDLSGILPDKYNWKPYWGISEQAAIVHFHGAKPGFHAECFAVNGDSDFGDVCGTRSYSMVCKNAFLKYKITFKEQAKAYSHYVGSYHKFQEIFYTFLK